jgi:hypothetical protein
MLMALFQLDGTRRRGQHCQAWATLMHPAFGLDMLACPRCGGQPRVVAIVQDSAVVRAILAYLRLALGPDTPGPAPALSEPGRAQGRREWDAGPRAGERRLALKFPMRSPVNSSRSLKVCWPKGLRAQRATQEYAIRDRTPIDHGWPSNLRFHRSSRILLVATKRIATAP